MKKYSVGSRKKECRKAEASASDREAAKVMHVDIQRDHVLQLIPPPSLHILSVRPSEAAKCAQLLYILDCTHAEYTS